jgi:preprotein translocase subunit SecA
MVLDKALESIQKVDLRRGAQFLDPDFGLRSACDWVKLKFGVDMNLDEVKQLEPAAFKEKVFQVATQQYNEKEFEYPVIAGLYHFTTRDASGHKRYDREKLVHWAADRFHVELTLDDLRNKQRDEIRELLVDHSRRYSRHYEEALAELHARLDELGEARQAGNPTEVQNQLRSLCDWLAQAARYAPTPEELEQIEPQKLRRHLEIAVEERYRPEMRRMERSLVLQLLDTAWKDHLLAMDHLKSSIGLRGYAQVDPKVEYKREGMRTFEQMWDSVGQRVTDLVFRVEQLDEGFVGSTWTEAEARHEEAPSADEIAEQQQAAIDGMQGEKKSEPIRNRQQRVGRNDPCPCGSGKKFKNCCMKKGRGNSAA